MRKELKNAFGRVFLTIEVDTKNKWIYVNWMGYQTSDNVKTGAEAYTEALANAGFNCILNDTRLIVGSWDHTMDWVLNDWAPRAARKGLKRIAIITTPESFGESSASRFYADQKGFGTEVFDERTSAEEWLHTFIRQGS